VFQNIIKYVSVIVFPIAAYIMALSRQLVLVLYGATYDAAPLFLRIYMLNYFFIGLGATLVNTLLNSQKETKVNLKQTLLYLTVGVPIGFTLIPRYGVLGYFATTIFVPKIGLLYTLSWIRRSYGIVPDTAIFLKTLASSAVSGAAAYTVAYAVSYNPWIEITVSGMAFAALYVSSILFTGVIDARNLKDIYGLLEKQDRLKPIIDPVYIFLYRFSRKQQSRH
jgi:O-antigen/teichoic acid export membrane protein